MTPYNQIFQLHAKGLNNSEIERTIGNVTRKTVITVLTLAEKYGFQYPPPQPMSDVEIHRMLHPKKDRADRMPDMAQVMFEISLPGQSIASVWKAYSKNNPGGYSKTKFQTLVRECRDHYDIGEYKQLVYLRYVKDAFRNARGNRIHYLFAQMYHSRKVFAVAIGDNKARSWVHGLINLIHQIGGAPSAFIFLNKIPKSLTAITQDCLSYYGIIVEQSRIVTRPGFDLMIKDALTGISNEHNSDDEKASPFWVLRQACLKHNALPLFDESTFSVEAAFKLEAKYFKELPERDYDLTEYTDVRVQPNRHVEIDGNYYSVPFQYRHEKLTAYINDCYVDICYLDTIVCTHERLEGKSGKYSTDKEHLVPDEMVPFGELSGKSLRSWANKIGPNTARVIDYLLRIRTYEIQGYKVCNTILHYSTKYSPQILEAACTAAINKKTINYSFLSMYCETAQSELK